MGANTFIDLLEWLNIGFQVSYEIMFFSNKYLLNPPLKVHPSNHFHLLPSASNCFHLLPSTSIRYIRFNPLLSTSICFNPLPSASIHFQPRPFASIRFHPLPSASIHCPDGQIIILRMAYNNLVVSFGQKYI